MVGILIMLNNYFHDVATALLASSGFVMWTLAKRYDPAAGSEVAAYYVSCYQRITWLAKIALIWILLGGIPRTIAYRNFEWANAVGNDQVPALIGKHIVVGIMVGTGAYLWLRLRKRIQMIKERLER